MPIYERKEKLRKRMTEGELKSETGDTVNKERELVREKETEREIEEEKNAIRSFLYNCMMTLIVAYMVHDEQQ